MRRKDQAGEADPGPVPDEAEASFGELWESLPEGEVSGGRYRIYKTPEGGMHIVYRADGVDVDQHLPIPATMISMATGRGPLGKMAQMLAGRFGG